MSLRADTASGSVITLGDLFANAGPAAQVMVGYGAPAGESAVLDADQVQHIASLHGLDWSNPEGVRRILVRSAAAGAAARTVDVLTYAHNLAAGDAVQPQDVVYAKLAADSVPADAARDTDAIIGRTLSRPVRQGAAVEARDTGPAAPPPRAVAAARNMPVIKPGDLVEVTYRDGDLTLTLDGKATAAAAAGQVVEVLNTASKKTIQAVAIAPGQAAVGPDAEALGAEAQSANPTQIADLH